MLNISIGALLLAAGLAAEVRIRAADGFQLRATFEPAGSDSSVAVLILHQCDREAESSLTGWEPLFPLLRARGISILAPDFRGYGGSRTGKSEEEDARHTGPDVSAAFSYLEAHTKATRFAILGASCGCRRGAAIAAANPAKVVALTCISGSIGRPNPDAAFTAIAGLPVLAIAAENDQPWASQMRHVFDQSTSPASQFWLHKGELHGAPLLQQDSQLAHVIANWLTSRLESK